MKNSLQVTHEQKSRRPRFQRVASATSIQLTERDIEIVRQVASHRFLRSSHLTKLFAAPHQKVSERLTSLFHAGFLDRPRSQLQYHVRGGGSEHYVYGLGIRGARLLRDHNYPINSTLDWSRKNCDATHQFLQHTLAIADVRVALVVACRSRHGVTLRSADELLDDVPLETRSERMPWSWRISLQHLGSVHHVGLIPDYAFALMLPDGRRRPYLLECDRGTMPVERSRLEQTSVLRKFLAYEATVRAGMHISRFGWKNFRVLITTSGPERERNMQMVLERTALTNGSPLFLFHQASAILNSDILNLPWRDARGQIHTLV
jgi:hypothetical protein